MVALLKLCGCELVIVTWDKLAAALDQNRKAGTVRAGRCRPGQFVSLQSAFPSIEQVNKSQLLPCKQMVNTKGAIGRVAKRLDRLM